MAVHADLEARPEKHVCCVDIALEDGDSAALELKGELLGQANATENTEAVGTVLDELLGVGLAER
jgi:hypothetical protein